MDSEPLLYPEDNDEGGCTCMVITGIVLLVLLITLLIVGLIK